MRWSAPPRGTRPARRGRAGRRTERDLARGAVRLVAALRAIWSVAGDALVQGLGGASFLGPAQEARDGGDGCGARVAVRRGRDAGAGGPDPVGDLRGGRRFPAAAEHGAHVVAAAHQHVPQLSGVDQLPEPRLGRGRRTAAEAAEREDAGAGGEDVRGRLAPTGGGEEVGGGTLV